MFLTERQNVILKFEFMGVNEIVTKRWRQQESAFRFAFPQLCRSKNSLQCLLRLLSFLDPFHIWSLQKPSQLINIHLPLTDLNQPSLLRLAVQIISVFCHFQCTYKWIIYTVFAGLPLFTNQTLGKWIFWNWKSFFGNTIYMSVQMNPKERYL